MVININPNRINTAQGGAGKAGSRRQEQPEQQEKLYTPPNRATLNFIPAPESLRTLISSALEAVRRGVYWDRGTIVNLVV